MKGNIFKLEAFKAEANAAKVGKETGPYHWFSPYIQPCLQRSLLWMLRIWHHLSYIQGPVPAFFFWRSLLGGQTPPILRYLEPGHVCPPAGVGSVVPPVSFPPRREVHFSKGQQVLLLTVISLTSLLCPAGRGSLAFPSGLETRVEPITQHQVPSSIMTKM